MNYCTVMHVEPGMVLLCMPTDKEAVRVWMDWPEPVASHIETVDGQTFTGMVGFPWFVQCPHRRCYERQPDALPLNPRRRADALAASSPPRDSATSQHAPRAPKSRLPRS
jgi:hypothetical protein